MVGWNLILFLDTQVLYYVRINVRISGMVVHDSKSFNGTTRFRIAEKNRARSAERIGEQRVSLNAGKAFRAKLLIPAWICRLLLNGDAS